MLSSRSNRATTYARPERGGRFVVSIFSRLGPWARGGFCFVLIPLLFMWVLSYDIWCALYRSGGKCERCVKHSQHFRACERRPRIACDGKSVSYLRICPQIRRLDQID